MTKNELNEKTNIKARYSQLNRGRFTAPTATMNAKSDSDSDDDSVLGFGAVDFSGVDFDAENEEEAVVLRPSDFAALELEQIVLALGKNIPKDFFSKYTGTDDSGQDDVSNIVELGQQLAAGKYLDILKGASAQKLLGDLAVENADSKTTVPLEIRKRIFSMVRNVQDCIELECIGIAALNLFLQLNYTGPSLEECIGDIGTAPKEDPLLGIHPHPCFAEHLSASAEDSTVTSKTQLEEKEEGETKQTETSITTSSFVHTKFHNAVLAELAVDGEWPCQVCQVPYFLLLARSIFISLANPKSMDWMHSSDGVDETDSPTSSDAPKLMVALSKKLTGAHIWSARAAVAHGRLIQSIEPPITLWEEVKSTFERCVEKVCPDDLLADITNNNPDSDTLKVDDSSDSVWERRKNAATLMLEWGLAQHHFDQPGMGRKCFDKALEYSGLKTTLTGAQGVRTKFQTKQTAQMLVEAVSTAKDARSDSNNSDKENDSEEIEKGGKNLVKQQEVEVDDELLLGRVKFEDESKNKVQDLNVLDQAILLSLCLDVKNTNPSGDELTNEEMSAYLARVLDHHDDWMLYSTALLERSWLEFERTHGKERAILQVQALADQHTNRLTLTQSTKKSVEESAPVQDRLCNLHTIVYPPRWEILKDLGNRYANCGILMSAAELFTQIELWDEVVECYRRAGRAGKAEEIVRERLGIQETPRMWAALGDLTQDPTYWEKAVDLSKGRFSTALVALGAYYFEKGDVIKSAEYYEKSLEIRMIAPAVWFRLGTINMQLDKWDNALRAFSRVVQLEPEEHEAWANVAAIHMRNKNPTEAYPALNEVSFLLSRDVFFPSSILCVLPFLSLST